MVQEARNDLLTCSQLLDKNYHASWFHERIASILERALENVIKRKKTRIILTIPPRMGKTQLASINFPAWALGRYPELKFILSSYGADLSEKIGMKTRDLIASEKYQAIFPGVSLRQDSKAKAKWMTNQGGEFLAVGVGSAVTGSGGDIILIDDPHKDRAEAESALQRDNVWEYYRSTLYSRLEGSGAVIVIMQRWHTDDLVGRLKEEMERLKAAGESYDEWEVINFPAIAEEDEYIDGKIVRKKGEALWPRKFPLEVLDNIRQTQGVYNWASQYQQDPILAETQEFKIGMFKYYEPDTLKNKRLRYYTFVDPAISQKKEGDNTVVLTIAKEIDQPFFYRIREDAGHFTPTQTVELIFKHHDQYKSDVFLEVVAYQMALKFSLEEEQRRKGRYFSINEVKTNLNKEVKIRGLLPLYENGVIFHLKSDTEYEKELLQFPRGKHDDRIDCMSFLLDNVQNTARGQFAKQFKPRWLGYGKRA